MALKERELTPADTLRVAAMSAALLDEFAPVEPRDVAALFPVVETL